MYLKQLKITNYKSFFEATEFKFEPGFNVLLGANSSGKSSVLELLAALGRIQVKLTCMLTSPVI